MSETPSALNTALADELLPCTRMPLCESLLYEGHARADCPAAYRPAVALALQSKDDDAAREIERLKGEIARLRAALEPFASLADDYDERPRPYSDTELIWCNHATVGQLRKARAALQTDGGKSDAAQSI